LTTQAPPLRQSRDTFGGVRQLQKRLIAKTTQNKTLLFNCSPEGTNKNICASVAYLRDTNYYNNITIKNHKNISVVTNIQNKTHTVFPSHTYRASSIYISLSHTHKTSINLNKS